MERVFVYGTLKRGFPYHETGLAGQRLIGRCRTCEAYPLMISGPWYSPVLVAEPGVGKRVTGEVYAVDQATLAKLDRMEGTHLPNGYSRVSIVIEWYEEAVKSKVWTYVKERSQIESILEQDLAEYHLDPRYVLASERKR